MNQDPTPFDVIVLAAGEGTRMRSARPKVLHEVAGRSLIAHVLAAVHEAGASRISVVVGPGRHDVVGEAQRACPGVQTFVQVDRRGTAHAVLAAREALRPGVNTVVLFADTPLVRPATIRSLAASLRDDVAVSVLGFEARDPTGYGRLLTAPDGSLQAIREDRDASDSERAVRFCNAGLMALAGAHALELLQAVGEDNVQREFYLPDVVGIARALGMAAVVVRADEADVLGVNDRVQLAAAEFVIQGRLRTAAMRAGVTLHDPASTFLSCDADIAADVVIEPHVVIGAGVRIAARTVIHAFSHLAGADIGEDCSIGPFARLRPGTTVAAGARIGNFVETKATSVGPGAKVNHLTYIGDATVGASANIGAGTITCNYDGYAKHRTEIGAHAFIGSNSSLVAPVRIGAGAYIASGSVITEDVESDALAVARGRQANKPAWAKTFRTKVSARSET